MGSIYTCVCVCVCTYIFRSGFPQRCSAGIFPSNQRIGNVCTAYSIGIGVFVCHVSRDHQLRSLSKIVINIQFSLNNNSYDNNNNNNNSNNNWNDNLMKIRLNYYYDNK